MCWNMYATSVLLQRPQSQPQTTGTSPSHSQRQNPASREQRPLTPLHTPICMKHDVKHEIWICFRCECSTGTLFFIFYLELVHWLIAWSPLANARWQSRKQIRWIIGSLLKTAAASPSEKKLIDVKKKKHVRFTQAEAKVSSRQPQFTSSVIKWRPIGVLWDNMQRSKPHKAKKRSFVRLHVIEKQSGGEKTKRERVKMRIILSQETGTVCCAPVDSARLWPECGSGLYAAVWFVLFQRETALLRGCLTASPWWEITLVTLSSAHRFINYSVLYSLRWGIRQLVCGNIVLI